MIGRLRFVGIGAACLVMVAGVPGSLAAPPVPPGQNRLFGDVPPAAVATQDPALPAAPFNPYTSPACTGLFADVACPGGFAVNWIEKFYNDGITAGCGTNPLRYCPSTPVTRDQMAVFVEKAMRGTSTWSPGDLGHDNTGLGSGSLQANTTAWDNTAVGLSTLGLNTSASANTAVGSYALNSQSYDAGYVWYSDNTAMGDGALFSNQPTSTSNGIKNTAAGTSSLASNTTGFDNTAIGFKAGARNGDVVTGYTGASATFVNTVTGSFNTFVGIAGSTDEVSNCTAVGMDAYCDAGNQVRLGNYYVTSIGGKVNFSALSDARAKTDIRDLDLGLDFVMGLRPVSYHLKGGNGRTDMGFVAQDIEALMGDDYNVLDIGGDKDRTLSLRYTDLIAPMVKAIQEQQSTIEKQQAQIEGRDARIAALEARLAAIEAHVAGK